jgi:hypothetical protein
MNPKFLLAFIFIGVCIFGCKKADLSDTERFLPNTWNLNRYLVDGSDKTGSLLIHGFTEKIEEYDFYGYSYWCIDANQDSIIERGSTYTLFTEVDSIYFYSSFRVPLTLEDTFRGDRLCKITEITKKTFVYEFRLNGRLHEFQMVRGE